MAAAIGTVTQRVSKRSGFRRFWIALKQLFHELIGAIFAVLALFWVQNALRAWSRDGARWLIGGAAFLAVLMAAFSYTSFRSAKRLQSS